MNYLLKSDRYKLLKNKSTFICALVGLAFAVIAILSIHFGRLAVLNDPAGVSSDTLSFYQNVSFVTIFGNAFDTNIALFASIALSIFIGSEFSLGTIKNTASKSFKRNNIYMSKWLTGVAYSILLLLMYLLVFSVMSIILWGAGTLPDGFTVNLIISIGLAILVNISFASVFVMLAHLIRNTGVVAVCICVLSFTSTMVQLAQMAINQLFGSSINLLQFLPSTICNELVQNFSNLSSELIIRAIGVTVLVTVISTVIGLVSFKKRDIK